MSGENEGQGSMGGQGVPQGGHWLDEARDALHKRAGEQGQEWLGHAQDHVQDFAQQHVPHDATGNDPAQHGDWLNGEWIPHTQGHEAAPAVAALDLGERDRLPWLESAEDEDDYYAVDTRRVIAAVVGGLLLLAVVVGGVWAFTHRKTGAPVADGSVIGGSEQPYKQAPANPGGKQFEGTGDSSFAAAQGKDHPAQLANGDAAPAKDAPKPADAAKADAKPDATPAAANDAGPVGGVVQIAAYSNEAAAKSGWDKLVQQHEMLKGANHRIVQGQADIGTVYRLQLIAGAGGGSALCEKLKAEGVSCQVKH